MKIMKFNSQLSHNKYQLRNKNMSMRYLEFQIPTIYKRNIIIGNCYNENTYFLMEYKSKYYNAQQRK